MKKNLFFNSILQQTKKIEMSSAFSVLLVLMYFTPSFLFASAPQQNSADSEQQSNSIYISGNAKIFDADNTSEINLFAAKTDVNSSEKSSVRAKASDNSIAAQVEIKKENDLEKNKELEKKAKKNIKVTFANSTTNSNFANNHCAIPKGAVLSSSFYSQYKFSKAVSQDIDISFVCKSSKKKQKCYTLLSYLQFGKYRNSSLRAPPTFVV